MTTPTIWERYEDNISTYYLSALINDDFTGMPEYERKDFNAWRVALEQEARAEGWTVGHWTTSHDDGDEYFGKCSVSGLRSNLATVTLMVYKSE